MTRAEKRAIEQDCQRLVALYANLNDVAAWAEAASLFTDHGRLARPTAPDAWIEGRMAIQAAFEARPPRRTRHLCSNVVVTVRNEEEAIGTSAIVLYLADDVAKVGSFDDRFVRTDAGWRFAERRGTLTF